MGVVVRRTFEPLPQVTLLTVQDWRAIGELARERIVRRTLQGLDVDGRAFTPYSDRYEKQRRDAGVPVAQVTLQLSGEMLRGITVIPLANRVELTF